MKRETFIFSIIFFLLNINLQAQNEKIVLHPENGKEYIYEFTELRYILPENHKRFTDYFKKKSLKIKCVTIQPENKEYLMVSVIENMADKPEFKPVWFKDYRFPAFKDGFYDNRTDNFWEELLPWTDYQYTFDRETMEPKLQNRVEVLSEIGRLLERKGFEEKAVDKHTSDFNTKGIPQITRLLQSVYQISKRQHNGERIELSKFEEHITAADSLLFLKQTRKKEELGLRSRHFSCNTEKKILNEYSTTEIDSAKYGLWAFGKSYHRFYIEKSVNLKSVKNIPENRLVISGKIENPKNKKVIVGILRDPFGTSLYLETAFLDENNTFQLETELKHSGLGYIQFGQDNRVEEVSILGFYAEPGNRIHFNVTGDTLPWDVKISGDNSHASTLIYDFHKEYKLFGQGFNFNNFYWHLSKTKYADFYRALINSGSFFEKYKNRIPETVYDFVTTEFKNFLLSGVIHYLTTKKRMNLHLGRPHFPEHDEVDYTYLENLVNEFSLHRNYNDYGIHSRQLAGTLMDYHFGEINKIGNLRTPYRLTAPMPSGWRYFGDLPKKIEITKTVLTGHALYSQLAKILLQEKMNTLDTSSKDQRIIQDEITRYFDLMLRLVNNREFAGAIEVLLENHIQWQNEDYVPETQFFNTDGQPVYFADFFGEKPTVFYINHTWDSERYFWDDLAKENPEINFVLVMQGSNLKEWQDYIKRAEPVAHQLFMTNRQQQFRDIFKKDYHHFIAYDKDGMRIGFGENPVDAMNLAKHSLMTKKENPDKSQLITIIIILGSLLFISFLIFVLWRWRIRQRFRKEQQQRRLRELELTAIRSQMNPHFLFNCLNSVQNLVQQNKGREAHLYLADFAGLIRKVLQNSEKEEVSLAEELETVKQYLNLEKLRFDFDFQIKMNEGIDPHNTLVPSMLLQPFAENAVIHGLHNKPENRKLRIEVVRKSEQFSVNSEQKEGIAIIIEDNGIGQEAAQKLATSKNGKSSKLMQERLEILQQKQGEKYRLQITDLSKNGATGTRVEILVPEER